MDIVTARWNIVHNAGPLSASQFFTLPITGPVLIDLMVLCPLSTYDPSKSGFRVSDAVGRKVFPAFGTADQTAAIAGRGAYAPLLPLACPIWIEGINDEFSGPNYALNFEFYNEDSADFIALVFAKIGQDMTPLAVSVHNWKDMIGPIGGLVQDLIKKFIPPKA
jgi:hypothetical protein